MGRGQQNEAGLRRGLGISVTGMSTAQEINEERERLAELGLDPRRQWPPKMTWWKKDGTPPRNLRTDSYLRLLYLRKGFRPAPPSEVAQATV